MPKIKDIPKYILEHIIGKDYKWYVHGLSLYGEPSEDNSDWVLSHSSVQTKRRAMQFINKIKAERIADIINKQTDEMGGCSNYKVIEVKNAN